jgi:single-strand DNA-binding protein
MNRVVLIGRLTKNPELRFTPGTGLAVSTFTIAVDRRTNKEGKKETDFIPIVAWGKQGENVANYMSKGKLIGISGRIQTRNYEGKDGIKRYVTEIVADEVQFLERSDNSNTTPNNNNYDDGWNDPVDDSEEVPF